MPSGLASFSSSPSLESLRMLLRSAGHVSFLYVKFKIFSRLAAFDALYEYFVYFAVSSYKNSARNELVRKKESLPTTPTRSEYLGRALFSKTNTRDSYLYIHILRARMVRYAAARGFSRFVLVADPPVSRSRSNPANVVYRATPREFS